MKKPTPKSASSRRTPCGTSKSGPLVESVIHKKEPNNEKTNEKGQEKPSKRNADIIKAQRRREQHRRGDAGPPHPQPDRKGKHDVNSSVIAAAMPPPSRRGQGPPVRLPKGGWRSDFKAPPAFPTGNTGPLCFLGLRVDGGAHQGTLRRACKSQPVLQAVEVLPDQFLPPAFWKPRHGPGRCPLPTPRWLPPDGPRHRGYGEHPAHTGGPMALSLGMTIRASPMPSAVQ